MTKDEIRALLLEADALNREPRAGERADIHLRDQARAMHRVLTALIDLTMDLNEARP